MKQRLFSLLAAFIFILPLSARAANDLVVIEFFTSEGCSMCLPVAKVMEEIAPENDLLVLTWHVDYWDYMGWEDTLASPENTTRQEAYNTTLGHKGVFTPQVIVNGREEAPALEKAKLLRAIENAQASNGTSFDVAFAGDRDNPRVEIAGPDAANGERVFLVWYNTLDQVKIAGGENAGRVINYAHNVRDYKQIAEWTGEPLAIPLDLADPDRADADCIAVLVQASDGGPILAAAKIRLQ